MKEGWLIKEDGDEVFPAMGVPHPLRTLWEIHQSDPETPFMYHEAEIMMDAWVTGEFDLGPLRYYISEFGSASSSTPNHPLAQALGMKCYDVRSHPCYEQPPLGWLQADREESPSSIVAVPAFAAAQELAALMALFLRRRIWATRVTRDGVRPARRFHDEVSRVDPAVARQHNIVGFTEWLEKVFRVPEREYGVLMSAVGAYQTALVSIEDSPESAYVSLITCIEILSGHGCNKLDMASEEWMPADFEELLRKHVRTKKGRHEFKQWLYPREKIKRRFISFIVETTPEAFWDPSNHDSEIDQMFTVRRNELSEIVGRVYDCRSQLLHSGVPFPAHALSGRVEYAEHSKSDTTGTAVPSVRWFERLVNACVRNYVDRIVEKATTDPDQ